MQHEYHLTISSWDDIRTFVSANIIRVVRTYVSANIEFLLPYIIVYLSIYVRLCLHLGLHLHAREIF